jgi:hypothetical protein
LRCRDCGYVKEKIRYGIEYSNHKGVELSIEEVEETVLCEKIGGRVDLYGHCTDWNEDNKPVKTHNFNKRQRRNKRERDQLHKQHLKWLAENVDYYPAPVTYEDEIWIKGYGYIENPKPYYKRWYRNNHKNGRYKYYKKYANHVVRRYGGEIHNGCCYKKIFDYWWAVD